MVVLVGLAELQAGEGHEGLDGGAGRVGALQRAVVERSARVALQRAVVLGADALDEGVRVEAGLAHQRQHLAALRIDGGDGAVEIAQRQFGDVLQLGVEGEIEIAAWRAGALFQFAQRPAAGVGLDDARAGRAAQVVLVALLDAELADLVDALVQALVELGVVGLGDAAHITHHVARRRAHCVGTRKSGCDVHALEGEAVQLETRDLLGIEVGAQRHAAVARRLADAVLEARDVAGGEAHHRRELFEQGVHVLHLLARHFQIEGRPVLRQQRAVAVVDQAAHRRHRHHAHAVVVGAGAEVVVLQHLQVGEPRQQQQDHQQQCDARHQHAAGEVALLLVEILERVVAVHARCDESRPRACEELVASMA